MRPPFTEETARAKVKAAQDAWNDAMTLSASRSPIPKIRSSVAIATNSSLDVKPSKKFLKRKWARELDYTLSGRALGIHH